MRIVLTRVALHDGSVTKRPPLRFATRALLLQIAVVGVVVAVTVSIFGWIGVTQLRRDAESNALAIARTLADDIDVIGEVERMHDAGAVPSRDVLAAGLAQAQAERVRARTGALFIVITNADGIRLSHPDPSRLGEVVSTSGERALSGVEEIAWQRGTLGESARAKVPIFSPGTTTPIGQVSVGFTPVSVFAALPELIAGLALAAGFALVIGVLAAWRMRRWLSRITLGLQPEELRALVQEQAAVLEGVGEGVLAVTAEGEVTVCNERAADMLGLGERDRKRAGDAADGSRSRDSAGSGSEGVDGLGGPGGPGAAEGGLGGTGSFDGPADREADARVRTADGRRRDPGLVGRSVDELRLPSALRRVLEGGSEASFAVGARIVYAEGHRVAREGRDLGTVVVLRDRTDIEALSEKLDAVQSMTNALRAQRHEFANRLHVLAGLMDAGRDAEARGVIADALAVDPRDARVESAELVHDEYLRALVTALSIEARERSVHLRLGPETLVLGRVVAPEDVATILGNLVGNAVRAAVAAAVPRWVEVELLDDGDALFATVSDSGDGIRDPDAVFEGRDAEGADAAASGPVVSPARGRPPEGGGSGAGTGASASGAAPVVGAGAGAGAGGAGGAAGPGGASAAMAVPAVGAAGVGAPVPASGASVGAGPVHGHGIGLPLCRGIARARGGDVWIVDAGSAAETAPDARVLASAVELGEGGVASAEAAAPASAPPDAREGAVARADAEEAGRARRGAVVCARLPGVMAPRATTGPGDPEPDGGGSGPHPRRTAS